MCQVSRWPLPCTLRKTTVMWLLQCTWARFNTNWGSNTWFSSQESEVIHANIFSEFLWIPRVSWILFYWLHFDSGFQFSMALCSMLVFHWEQSYVSHATQFLLMFLAYIIVLKMNFMRTRHGLTWGRVSECESCSVVSDSLRSHGLYSP